MTAEETKKTIVQYTSGEDAELVYRCSGRYGGLTGVENGEFLFANGMSLFVTPKSLLERWAEEDKFLEELGGYWGDIK